MENSNGTKNASVYQKIRRRLTLFHLFFTPLLLLILILTGLSFGMRRNAVVFANGNEWGVVAVYFMLFSLYFLIFDLPVSYYSGFLLEHKFGLSNQRFRDWLWESFKKGMLSFALSLALLELLYGIIRRFPETWWLWAWGAYAFVSYVMGKIFPVFIVPLFYKYSSLEDKVLEGKVHELCKRYGMPVENVYSLNLSKTTKKANAAFMGIGRTKRVVLSDTLIHHFTHPEVEVVVAHELGHFRHHDVWRLFFLGMVTSFLAFGLGFFGMREAVRLLQMSSAADVAGLPILFLIFYIVNFILTPFQNAFSRHQERQADLFALETCRNKNDFISCMQKLGSQNLADPNPPGWYEWLFYDHPAIGKRIEFARQYERT